MQVNTKIKISKCSGIDSGKIGKVISKEEYNRTTKEDGYSKNLVNTKNWIPILLDDGVVTSMPANRLNVL